MRYTSLERRQRSIVRWTTVSISPADRGRRGAFKSTMLRSVRRTRKNLCWTCGFFVFSTVYAHKLFLSDATPETEITLNVCTEAEVDKNSARLRMETTNCPSEPWYWHWHTKIYATDFTYVEIGCNKGTDAVANLRAFTGDDRIRIDEWQRHTQLSDFACPYKDVWRRATNSTRRAAQHYKHYCIEAARENFKPVYTAAKRLGYDKKGLIVHHAAASSSHTPGVIKFPAVRPGVESVGISTDNSGYTEFYDVKVITIDRFVIENKIKKLDVLKIDTEGHDPLVIIGAVKTLMALKPSYLQFENHGVGRWSTFELKDVIDLLDNLLYTCVWATNSGVAIQITSCWSEEYSKVKQWSNIACYHRSDTVLTKIIQSYM